MSKERANASASTSKKQLREQISTHCLQQKVDLEEFFQRAYSYVRNGGRVSEKQRRGIAHDASHAYSNFKNGFMPDQVKKVLTKYLAAQADVSQPLAIAA